jgi:cell division GTPase FtsZ
MSNDILNLDGFDDLLADLPQEVAPVEDTAPHALKVGIIGAGQAGCNLASTFWDICGYRRVILFNTTANDVRGSVVPENLHVIAEGFDGAGKDREIGRRAVESSATKILAAMSERFGADTDYIVVMASGGGGTGSGAAVRIAEFARQYLCSKGISQEDAARRVGFLVMLPTDSEGSVSKNNALGLVNDIEAFGGSPVMYIDNGRVSGLVKATLGGWYSSANTMVARLFDMFNFLASRDSDRQAFDPQDYRTVLSSGLVSMGLTRLNRYTNDMDLANALQQNLKASLLVDDMTFSSGSHAAIIVLGDEATLNQIPMSALDNVRTVISTLLGSSPSKPVTIHTGIYANKSPTLQVFSMLGGLSFPASKKQKLGG